MMTGTVLVTGAGGYIGSVLVPKLLDQGWQVRALDRFFFGQDKLVPRDGLQVIREDARRITPDHLRGVDAVIDLVAISNDPSGELYQEATWQINFRARAATARMARDLGATRYILPSSCSIYGFQEQGVIVDEASPTHPLTTYAKANEQAEQAVLALAGAGFTAVVIRQATVYGYSPRMRFDLAINGMTYGAWKQGVLPLMRDGTQWRPMVHVQDTTDAMALLLKAPAEAVCGQIFNVGSDRNNYQLGPLAEEVVRVLPRPVTIEWYGDPDHRSYRVAFGKVERTLGWKARMTAADGALEVWRALEGGYTDKDDRSITLTWYRELEKWHRIIREVELYGGILDLPGAGPG
jgi:nucleoside-diphosphate-sugar epimerase